MEQYCLVFFPIDLETKLDRKKYCPEEITQIKAHLRLIPERIDDGTVTPGDISLTVYMKFRDVKRCNDRVIELQQLFQNSKIKRLDVTPESERRKNGFYKICKSFGYTFISAFISSLIALYFNEYPNVTSTEIPSVLLLAFVAAAAVALGAVALIAQRKAEKMSEEII